MKRLINQAKITVPVSGMCMCLLAPTFSFVFNDSLSDCVYGVNRLLDSDQLIEASSHSRNKEIFREMLQEEFANWQRYKTDDGLSDSDIQVRIDSFINDFVDSCEWQYVDGHPRIYIGKFLDSGPSYKKHYELLLVLRNFRPSGAYQRDTGLIRYLIARGRYPRQCPGLGPDELEAIAEYRRQKACFIDDDSYDYILHDMTAAAETNHRLTKKLQACLDAEFEAIAVHNSLVEETSRNRNARFEDLTEANKILRASESFDGLSDTDKFMVIAHLGNKVRKTTGANASLFCYYIGGRLSSASSYEEWAASLLSNTIVLNFDIDRGFDLAGCSSAEREILICARDVARLLQEHVHDIETRRQRLRDLHHMLTIQGASPLLDYRTDYRTVGEINAEINALTASLQQEAAGSIASLAAALERSGLIQRMKHAQKDYYVEYCLSTGHLPSTPFGPTDSGARASNDPPEERTPRGTFSTRHVYVR